MAGLYTEVGAVFAAAPPDAVVVESPAEASPAAVASAVASPVLAVAVPVLAAALAPLLNPWYIWWVTQAVQASLSMHFCMFM